MTTQKPFSFVAVLTLGGLCAGGSVYLFSGDSLCSAIGAAMIAGLISPLADRLGRLAFGRSVHDRAIRRWGRKHQFILVVCLALVFTVWCRLDLRRESFEAAFGIAQPSTVTGFSVKCYYAGGPGDLVYLMRFHADRAAIQRIISKKGSKAATHSLRDYLAGDMDWDTFWQASGGSMAEHFDKSWKTIPKVSNPQVYEWSKNDRGPIEDVNLIWDPATGEAYVVYTVG